MHVWLIKQPASILLDLLLISLLTKIMTMHIVIVCIVQHATMTIQGFVAKPFLPQKKSTEEMIR